MRKIKILLVEDDPGWKEAVSYFLDREPDLFLVGAAQTKEDAVSLVQMLDIDVVLINAMLNGIGTDSVEAALEINSIETSILRFIYGGHTQSEIMSTLHISESTVKKHVNKVIKKLGTQTSKEAARKASMKGNL